MSNPSEAEPSLPAAVEVVLPEYPSDMRLKGDQDVYLRVPVNPDGSVKSDGIVVVSSTASALSQSCVNAVKQWKFEAPAHNISVIVHIKFRNNGKVISDYPGADTR